MIMISLSLPGPVRKYQDRQFLRRLMLERARSEPTKAVDEAYFDTLRDHAGTRTAK